MPFVNIKIAGLTLAPEQVQRLQSEATRLMAEVMRKNFQLTAVQVEQVAASGWTVGGVPVKTAAHLDVKVTGGTNTADEKRRFIAEATDLLRTVVGPTLNPVTYVVVDEIAADTWGYGGMTQAARAGARPEAGATAA